MLEAPVSGSTPQAQNAHLVFLIGGDAETLRRTVPLLRGMGSSVQHAGPVGAGALAKLVTNTLSNPTFHKLLLKDLEYTGKTAGGDASIPTVSAVRDLFQRAMHEKLGDLNMTAVVQLEEA